MKLKLYVRQDTGKGKLVVLLHGLFGDGTQWEKCTELLVASGHRVVTIDLLGHGKSPRPKHAEFNAKENVQALRNALEEIDATQDATVVGYSMGGAVALSYCAAYPDAASRLIIISTPFYLKPEQMLLGKYAASVFVTEMSGYAYSAVNYLLGPGKPLAKMLHYTDNSDKFHKMIGAYDNKLDPRVVQGSIANLVHHYDFAGELAKIKIPVSLYCGKKDAFIVQEQLYALKQFNPYMDIQRLDIIKVDHMLVQNLPKEIVQFISKDDTRLLSVTHDTKHGTPLVLLHGIESSSTYWDHVVPTLAEHNRVITVDLLGFGSSPKPTNIAYSAEDHVAYLHDTIRSLGLKKFKIAAHSLGTIIALAYAAAYPSEVSGMYLFAPVLSLPDTKSRRLLINRMKIIRVVADTGTLHPEVAKAIGDTRLKKLLPTIRSVENTVQKQQPAKWAQAAKHIPVTFVYGTNDSLVDSKVIERVASIFDHATIAPQTGKGHNFAITNPSVVIETIDGQKAHKHHPKQAHLLPHTFMRQVASLAAPGLMLKSCAYLLFGLLLFTQYAPMALTIGLAGVIINKSYKIIRGAFSLKHEGLAYIGYLFLGLFIALVSYGLLKHPDDSVKIAVFTLCGIVLLAGALRLLAARYWTKKLGLRRSLYTTGTLMTFLGIAAFMGGAVSINIIIYAIAMYLCMRGLLYGVYATSMIFFAFMRGYGTS